MKPRTIRSHLFSALDKVADNYKDYVVDPQKDFSRMRCISFRNVLAFPISQGPKAISKELPVFFRSSSVPTASALRQQRNKVSFAAFQDVFRYFTDSCLSSRLSSAPLHKYHLLAVDGSRIVSAPNPFDVDSSVLFQENVIQNEHHLNALYSLSYGVYCDAVVQPYRHMNECRALCDMVSRSSISNALLLADRNYESYNVFAHLQQKNWKFLIRIKDSGKGSIAAGLSLPDQEEFIAPFHLALSRKTISKHAFPDIPSEELHNHFKKMNFKNPFDLPFDDDGLFPLDFAIVRIKVSDSLSETLITNLDLPIQDFKALYALRWGIETAFRHLKYSIGLLAFHSKKEKFLLQDIFAALILYNFSRFVASSFCVSKNKRKYVYIVNFSLAVDLCRRFLLNLESSPRLESLFLRDLSPIRSNRSFSRKVRSIGFIGFNYRLA